MKTVLSPKAVKYLKDLSEPTKSRIKSALQKLELHPPQGDIAPLTAKEGYRLRVGKYRILFAIKDDIIVISEISPRDKAYKRR